MHLGHRKTRKSFDKEGDAHFLTFSCYRRLPLFSKERTCQWMIEAIDKSKQKNPFDLWAWVIMPEHVHLVLLPHENIRIAAILSTMKLSISKRAITWTKNHAPKFLDNLLVSKSSDKKFIGFGKEVEDMIETFARPEIFMKRFVMCIKTLLSEGWLRQQKLGLGRVPRIGQMERTLF